MEYTPQELDEAIASIECYRQTHVDWGEYAKKNPEVKADPTEPVVSYVGDIQHHEDCIVQYDKVLKILRSLKS